MYAASNGKASIIRALLTAKARVDEVDERGATWLMEQMRSNEQPCCSLKDVFNKCGFDVVRKTKTTSWHFYFILLRYTYSKLIKICLTHEQLLPCFSNAHAHIYNVLSSRNLQEGNAAFCPSAV